MGFNLPPWSYVLFTTKLPKVASLVIILYSEFLSIIFLGLRSQYIVYLIYRYERDH